MDATGKEGPAWPKRSVFPPLLTKQVAALEVAFQLPVLRPPAWWAWIPTRPQPRPV